jgi:hypothetical protein
MHPCVYPFAGVRPWASLNLSTSFRLPPAPAAFINEAMLGGLGRIASCKPPGKPVYYHTGNNYAIADHLAISIAHRYKRGTLKADDVMILANSIKRSKGRTPLHAFEQKLVECGVPVYVPNIETAAIDETVSAGKVLFATFCQTKGLERRLVVVFGFSNDYFKFYNRAANRK